MKGLRSIPVAFLALLCASCVPDAYPGEEGDILHFTLRLLPKTFDPPKISEEGSNKLASQIYDGLLTYHPYARPYKLVPAIAAALPEVSEDGRIYTFKINTSIRFQDDPCFPDGKGRNVNVQDVMYCMKRFAHPTSETTGWWLFQDRIVGFDDWRKAREADVTKYLAERGTLPPATYPGIDAKIVGKDHAGNDVQGIEIVGDDTIVFRLNEPYDQLLWVLAMNYTAIYPKEAVEHYGDQYKNHPVATGPFKVVEFNPVYRCVMTRNENYREEYVPDPRNKPEDRLEGWDWEADEKAGLLEHAGQRLPMLDGMEVRYIVEDQPRWLYFKAGYSDFLNPPKDSTDQALPGGELSPELVARGIRLDPWPELGTVYSCINTIDPVLKNVDLRRAIALATDHKWTCKNLYAGQAIVATSVIPPGVAGYDANDLPYHNKDGSSDIPRARELLAKAGYPNGVDSKTGKRLKLVFENSSSSATAKEFSDRFVFEMRQLGIEVDVMYNTFPQMIDKMRKSNFQVAGLAWGFDYPDAQNIFVNLYGPNKAPGANYASFQNERFDELYRKAALLRDGPERTKLYEEMAHIVSDQIPWVTRAHRIRQNLQQPWLSGMKYTEVNYQFWRYCAVDDAMRDQRVAEWNKPNRWPLIILSLLFALLVGKTVFSSGGARP
ncbi:MAG: hypothetical protein KDC95_01660 [Planctomycetes bacterium]|nr:hypothetical protein [Planctomycetota bacterium]